MKNSAKAHGHLHGEAFMLMWYACKCGHKEQIWNSRDGVTPFCVGCPSCGGMTLQHIDWRGDLYAPGHQPHRGQRFFRDGTPDEAVSIMERRMESMKDTYPLQPGEREALIEDVRTTGAGEFGPGWPKLDLVDGNG